MILGDYMPSKMASYGKILSLNDDEEDE